MDNLILKRLLEEKRGKISGGLYHYTQVNLSYNSNKIEGSRLTREQTRLIFETQTVPRTAEDLGKKQLLSVCLLAQDNYQLAVKHFIKEYELPKDLEKIYKRQENNLER